MPPALLALMFQSAFRVTFERESLRLAALVGVVPGLAGFLGSLVGSELLKLEAIGVLYAGVAGSLLGFVLMVPLAVRAAGDLLARLLDRPPQVSPAVATGRALRLIGSAFLIVVGMALGISVIGAFVPTGIAASVTLMLLLGLGIYVFLGFALLAQVTFYENTATIARGFALARGERARIFAFLLVVALPFVLATMLLNRLALAQPDGALWMVGLAVALLAGFVNALSTGPHLIGLTQFYFAKRGEEPPLLNNPAAPRT